MVNYGQVPRTRWEHDRNVLNVKTHDQFPRTSLWDMANVNVTTRNLQETGLRLSKPQRTFRNILMAGSAKTLPTGTTNNFPEPFYPRVTNILESVRGQ